MRATSSPQVQRLCEHHVTSGFDCGVKSLNEQLKFFQQRFAAGERVLGFVAVDSARQVLGYVILSDTTLLVPGSKRVLRCLTVPAFAVDVSHQRRELFRKLIEAAMQAMALRQKSAPEKYAGILCLPDRHSVLERWLVNLGFQPLGSEGLMWLPFDAEA
jgi:hypothetical protein